MLASFNLFIWSVLVVYSVKWYNSFRSVSHQEILVNVHNKMYMMVFFENVLSFIGLLADVGQKYGLSSLSVFVYLSSVSASNMTDTPGRV